MPLKLNYTPTISDIKMVVLPQVAPKCGPLFFASSIHVATGNIIGNGSYGLVDTGAKKLLVTCCHVWTQYEHLRKDNPEIKLCVCLDRSHPVVFENAFPIDVSENLDIATFDMQPFLAACKGREFSQINCNYTPPVKVGDPLIVVGYPGIYRSESDNGIKFGRTPHVIVATDVNATRITSDISRVMGENRELYFQSGQQNPYGGISGGPCFLIKESSQAVLVGFVTEFVEFKIVGRNVLRSTSVRCLNADGTIKQML